MGVYPAETQPHHDSSSSRLALPKADLHIVHKSIDIRTSHFLRGTPFEDVCFNILAYDDAYANKTILGPHLVDHALGYRETAQMIKPDAIMLNIQGDRATIVGLAEFKSGTDIGFKRKLNGFQNLLKWFTKNPRTLPWLLAQSIGDHYETPKTIIIPDHRTIEVLFMAPFENGVVYENTITPFQVKWQSVPSKPLAA